MLVTADNSLLGLLILSVVVCKVIRLPCRLNARFNREPGKRFQPAAGGLAHSRTEKSVEDCALSCVGATKVNYLASKSICELFNDTTHGVIEKMEGWEYLHTNHNERYQPGSVCERRPCEVYQTCRDTCQNPHGYTCNSRSPDSPYTKMLIGQNSIGHWISMRILPNGTLQPLNSGKFRNVFDDWKPYIIFKDGFVKIRLRVGKLRASILPKKDGSLEVLKGESLENPKRMATAMLWKESFVIRYYGKGVSIHDFNRNETKTGDYSFDEVQDKALVYYQPGRRPMYFSQAFATRKFTRLYIRADGKFSSTVISSGYFDQAYQVLFSVTYLDKVLLYGHSLTSLRWFVREIQHFSRTDVFTTHELANGTWPQAYHNQVAYAINGRNFLYARSATDNSYFVRPLHENGTIGDVISVGNSTFRMTCHVQVGNTDNT